MNAEIDRLLAKIRTRSAELANSCDLESLEAHLRSLAGEIGPTQEQRVPAFPPDIEIAYATCACGTREFIVDGSTQECQFCGALMFRQATAKYTLARNGA